jgi:hypothetical protein
MKKKIFAVIGAVFIALVAFAGPSSATGSDSPTPYTVNANGVTLPGSDKFQDGGHVNIKYKVNGGSEKSAGIHFESLNNQPSGKWIGKNNLPWSAFNLSGDFCVTWVQINNYNEHFGEGGQAPFCVGSQSSEPDPNSKKVTLCHATGSGSNPYTGITVSVQAFYNAGHINHNGDIWESFTYTTVGGQNVTVPARGDASLLNFPNCKKPADDVKVVATTTQVDKCGTANDDVKLVPGTGYAGAVTKNGLVYTITAETSTGYVFDASQMTDWTLSNGNSKAVKTVTLTNADCDLPETGGAATYNTKLGLIALGGFVILAGSGVALLVSRKRA